MKNEWALNEVWLKSEDDGLDSHNKCQLIAQ